MPDTDFLDRMLRIGRHPGRETRAAFGLGDSDGIRAGRAPAGALRVAGAIPLPGDGAASSGVDSSCGQRGPGAQRRGRGVLRGPGPRRPGARAFVPAGRQGPAGGVNGRRRPPAPSLRGSAARAWPPGHASVQERTPSGLEERTRNRSPATTSPSRSVSLPCAQRPPGHVMHTWTFAITPEPTWPGSSSRPPARPGPAMPSGLCRLTPTAPPRTPRAPPRPRPERPLPRGCSWRFTGRNATAATPHPVPINTPRLKLVEPHPGSSQARPRQRVPALPGSSSARPTPAQRMARVESALAAGRAARRRPSPSHVRQRYATGSTTVRQWNCGNTGLVLVRSGVAARPSGDTSLSRSG